MYYPCFIYVSILLETTTVYFPVSILWICLCVMYKASIVWTVDSLVGCIYDIRMLLMFQNVTYKFLISLRLYQFIFSVIYKFFISRCDTLILLFFVWCINTVFHNDTHQSYFCVKYMNSIFLYDIPFLYCYRMYDINAIIYFFCMLLPIQMH